MLGRRESLSLVIEAPDKEGLLDIGFIIKTAKLCGHSPGPWATAPSD